MSTTARHARMLDATTPEAPLAPNLQRYWNDPSYRAEHEADRAEHYRRANALIDEGIRKHRAKLEQSL